MNLLATPSGRKILFAALYMSEGAPIGFIWWALPTKLRATGVDVESITALTSLLALPWALKFLWAPLVDTLQRKLSLRGWILLSQAMMGLTLVPLFFLDLRVDFTLLGGFLFLHAISAATQDVSIDALCIRVTTHGERGAINGWMQAGMLTSRSLLGGGSLLIAEFVGEKFILVLLLAVVWSSSLFLIFSREPATPHAEVAREGKPSFLPLLKHALQRRSTWLGLLFAAVAGAGYEAVGAVAGPFLVDRGFSSTEVGWFFLFPAVACMIAGSLLGGLAADRMRRGYSVTIFLAVMALCVILLAGVDLVLGGDAGAWYIGGLALLYFSIGLFTSSSYALFMDLTDPALGATQFSAFMGATNLCESWSAFSVGKLAGAFGYPAGFAVMGLISLIAVPLVRFLKPTRVDA